MKNWPADLDHGLIDRGGEYRHFGYDIRQWLDVHPESLLGKAWALSYVSHKSTHHNYPEEYAYGTIEDLLWCHVKNGANDFDQVQGEILAAVMAARLEGK